jgi:hypothetical protein
MVGMTVEIPLTKGYVALVDDEDAAAVLASGKWTAVVSGQSVYAHRRPRVDGRSRTIYLHRFLTGWPMVDHIDGDGLNNRRANLRPANKQQNSANRGPYRNNTSGYKGVSWQPDRCLYVAQICVSYRLINLGRYADPADAARAYDAAAREHFGEYARLNFPEDPR